MIAEMNSFRDGITEDSGAIIDDVHKWCDIEGDTWFTVEIYPKLHDVTWQYSWCTKGW